MSRDPRVQELLEELLNSEGTPEEVCHACPELLPQVKESWLRLRVLQTQIGLLFPAPEAISDAATPRPGTTTSGLPQIPGYEVREVLGRGGVGVVFEARHLRLDRTVALKMLLAGPYAQPEELERFFREAQAVAGLRHANIVQVYDVGDADGRPYFTMELVEGGSLAAKIAGAPQPAARAAALVATVAEAVHVAHRSGIIHRDLKPANILLTADGTPKVTDFGLARRLEGGSGLTITGVPIGTPSYMAPEQALGQKSAIGPATDVYALGAILYEMLTGRPPFRAETGTATLKQVVADEPVPPVRLNPRVPRDLETICLKCLHKERARRYATAAALAEDLRRFLRGEPIAARPPGRRERLARWLRRRPVRTALLAATVLVAVAAAGGGGWLIERTRTARAVEAGLREVVRLQEQSDLPEARATLERAQVRLGDGGPEWARALLERTWHDQRFLERLEAIVMARSTFVEGTYTHSHLAEVRFHNAEADREYGKAFREAGLGEPPDDPHGAVARIKTSALHLPVVAALDDWAVCSADRERQNWILQVARGADPDAWRDRVRDPAAWTDGAALADLAGTAPVGEQPIRFLLALGERLQVLGGDGIDMLRRVHQQHPDDFGTNFTLAKELYSGGKQEKGDPAPAIAYYEKALAVRPGTLAALNDLGLVLYAKYWLDDNAKGWGAGAITIFHRTLRIDPAFAPALSNLGRALQAKGNWPDAMDAYREALRVDPRLAPTHTALGEMLAGMGQLNEAIDHYRQAVLIDPEYAAPHYLLGVALAAKAWFDEVVDRFAEGAKVLDEFRGQALRESLDHYNQACTFDPRWSPARNPLRISPGDAALLHEAMSHHREAIHIDPQFAVAHGALGQALLAERDFAGAETATRRSLEWLPSREQGYRSNLEAQLKRCRDLLALEGRLPAILQGMDRPVAGECLDLAELCYVKKHHAAAARLYAEALASAPRLTDDLRAGHRFNAACAAALAGCGLGDDGTGLGPPELTALRRQARDWLQLDLTAWAAKLDAGTIADHIHAHRTFSAWRNEPDLAGLRDEDALERLSPAEREECLALWQKVAVEIKRVQTAR